MKDVVQLWKIPLSVSDHLVKRYALCLSESERVRADRFRFTHDRQRFVVARGTLRHLLGSQFSCSPQSVEFCYGEYGKPSLLFTASSLSAQGDFHFNLSHSGELALCAIGYHRRVGVDIEKVKPIERLEGMLNRCLGETEQAQVATAENSTRAFLQYWTCKEAYLKAIGKGLNQSMKTVAVKLTPPQLIQVPEDCTEGWHLDTVALPTDYVGAIVMAGKATIRMNTWQHSLLLDDNDRL